MAKPHEETAAELHAQVQNQSLHRDTKDLSGGDLSLQSQSPHNNAKDLTGGDLSLLKENETQNDWSVTTDGATPNEHDLATLPRIGESLPASAYLIAAVEFCERFTYYGCQGLFQNYISNSPDGTNGTPGLGLGHAGATGLNVFFQFFCYVTPILGAIIADQYLGRYRAILAFAIVYFFGLLILWTTALPTAMEHNASLPGYIVSIIIIGIGTGGIKSNVAPLIADQYTRKSMAIGTDDKGSRVIIDPAITYQRIYMIFYFCINVGSLSLLATPFMEKYKGFWTAYLLCFCMFIVGLAVLVLGRSKYVVRPPQGSVITDAFKAIGMMIVARNQDAAKPSWRQANGKNANVNWNDHFVEELKRALRACQVFAFYPMFWVCYGQFSSNFVSQAAQMQGHGMPNDLMQNFDPISIIVFLPILDRFVYPVLRKAGIPLGPIARISIGFWLAALCLAYAAVVQHLVYSAGPCFGAPLACAAGLQDNGSYMPNNVHIVVQTPAYVFIGLSEIFISVTGLEYAYTKAPPSMKSFIQSLYLFTSAFGSALSEALVPATGDPAILWMYTGVSIAAFLTGIIFYTLFKRFDAEEDKMNQLNKDEGVKQKKGEA